MYHHVFVGGTFDGLHKGHEAILTAAFSQGEHVTVGLTSDEFVQKLKNSHGSIKSFEERKQALVAWLTQKGWVTQAVIIGINDKYEPAASDKELTALVVTAQNKNTGEEINDLRKKRGLAAFTLLEVLIVPAEDGQPISSTRVRSGEIDPTGKYVMPETLRSELQKPLGRMLTGQAISDTLSKLDGRTVITVGDVVTKTFLDAGVFPALAVIDLRVSRKPDQQLAHLGANRPHIPSGPGSISKEAIAAIGTWAESQQKSNKPEVIVIDGEEDLLVLPVILAAPLESLVYYGQPPLRQGSEGQAAGVVEVEVTIEKKKEMTELLKKFSLV